MKTLTKILSVTALVVLCVCLFTLTAFAHGSTAECKEAWAAAGYGSLPEGPASNTPSTCIDKGYIEYYVCPDAGCNRCYDKSDPNATDIKYVGDKGSDALRLPIDPDAHVGTAEEHAETESDCKTNTAGHYAYKYYPCCGLLTDDSGTPINSIADVTKPIVHDADGFQDYEPPTCIADGHLPYYTCTVCGKLLDGGKKVTTWDKIRLPKTGVHTFDESDPVVVKAPTDVSPGWQVYTCTICGATKEEKIPALGIGPEDGGQDIDYVVPIHDTWAPGEEALTFESSLVKRLNDASGWDANFVGVRIGQDSLYENSYDTFDFWSWDKYVKLGDKTMAGLTPGKYRLWIYDKRYPDQYTCSCDFWVLDAPTLDPYSTDKHVVNSTKSLRFVASEEIDPNSVRVGSKLLYDANDYFVSNDRRNITLSAEFLNNRQTGTYTISARTKDGQTIKTNFYILTTAQASSSPRTGDESQIGLWAAFLLLSGAAVVVLVPKLRKQGAK